jgi:hypothetical protein
MHPVSESHHLARSVPTFLLFQVRLPMPILHIRAENHCRNRDNSKEDLRRKHRVLADSRLGNSGTRSIHQPVPLPHHFHYRNRQVPLEDRALPSHQEPTQSQRQTHSQSHRTNFNPPRPHLPPPNRTCLLLPVLLHLPPNRPQRRMRPPRVPPTYLSRLPLRMVWPQRPRAHHQHCCAVVPFLPTQACCANTCKIWDGHSCGR